MTNEPDMLALSLASSGSIWTLIFGRSISSSSLLSWHPASIAGLMKVVWAEWLLPSEVGQRPITGLPDRCHAV